MQGKGLPLAKDIVSQLKTVISINNWNSCKNSIVKQLGIRGYQTIINYY